MKRVNYILFLLTTVGFSDLNAQNLYGFERYNFISFDLDTGMKDTLISFDEGVWDIFNANRATIDRYNGFYYVSGKLPGLEGEFHVIDLINLSINSYDFKADALEYNWIRDKIIYADDGAFYTLNLSSFESSFLNNIPSGLVINAGQRRTFIPHSNEYMYFDFSTSVSQSPLLMINCDSGNINCSLSINLSDPSPFKTVTNNYNGDIFTLSPNSQLGILDPCSGMTTSLTSIIPDFQGTAAGDMASFNHSNNTYILPYRTSGGMPKIAVIDIYNDTILDVFSFGLNINEFWYVQQIYEKPIAPIVCLNDTLFVPKGQNHQWYLDDELIGETTHNYWVPEKTGVYKAYVDYREYSTLSMEKEILSVNIKEIAGIEEFKIIQNISDKTVQVITKESQDLTVKILDMNGRLVRFRKTNSKNPIILLDNIISGIYIIVVQSDRHSKLSNSKKILIPY